MLTLKRFDEDGDRYHLRPIRFAWNPSASCWFKWHGWQTGAERCAYSETSKSCVPGYRRVFGQTLHFGPLKVMFGRKVSKSSEQVP